GCAPAQREVDARRFRHDKRRADAPRNQGTPGAQHRLLPTLPWHGEPAAVLGERSPGWVVAETLTPVVGRCSLEACRLLADAYAAQAGILVAAHPVDAGSVQERIKALDLSLECDAASAERRPPQDVQAEAVATIGSSQVGDWPCVRGAPLLRPQA